MEKLVRDRIPELMRKAGVEPAFRVASREERLPLIIAKLREEIDELELAPTLEELADVTEALMALQAELGFGDDALEVTRARKLHFRGGFGAGFVLTVSAP